MWFNQLQLQSISLLAATSASGSLSFKSFEGKVNMTFKKQLPYQPLSVVRLLMFNYFIAYGLWLEKCFRFRKGNVVRQHCVFSIWRLILILHSLTFLLLSVIYFSFQWIYHELKLETRKSLYLVFCSQFFARN